MNAKKIFSRIVKIVAILAISAVIIYGVRDKYRGGRNLNFKELADDVMVKIDGEDYTLADMAYYIMYEEMTIEKEAIAYDPGNTRNFWNTSNGGKLLSGEAHKAVMGMMVHDQIFYQEALKEGLELDAGEKEYLENCKNDFWEDLVPEQLDNMYTSKDTVNDAMDKMALAQKYQKQLAKDMDISYHRLDWDAFDFKPIKEKHNIKINEKSWTRIRVGEVTLRHVGFDTAIPDKKGKDKK